MKRWILLLISIMLFSATGYCAPTPLDLSAEEKAWISKHRSDVYTVGYDPFAGMDFFDFRGKKTGLMPMVLKDIEEKTGIRLVPANVNSWDDAYSQFLNGRADVLYGANPTPERQALMVFTQPFHAYPYAVFAQKDSSIQTLGDLDGKRIGFLEGDYVMGRMKQEYANIRFQTVQFQTQQQGLKALISGDVEGFITSGGGIVHEYMYNYPQVTVIAELPAITSDVTFAFHKDQAVLCRIVDKYIAAYRESSIQKIIRDATLAYNRKILRFTDAELKWLDEVGIAQVGVADDYLPFDYFSNGEYKGIAGAELDSIREITGIRFNVVRGPFSELYSQALSGAVDVLNLAKTEDRLKYFYYPKPISTERDIIIGRKESAPVQDVYGLENRRVAVIEGFWHEEYLRKNLKSVRIIMTKDIQESLRMVREGKADYLIENPTVAEYYINGLGYNNLVKRGVTSKDSFVYFGVTKKNPELASIMDKAMTLIRFEDVKYKGIQTVPVVRNEQNSRLMVIVAGLAALLVVVMMVSAKIMKDLINQKAQTQILKEREQLLYTDSLTGLRNRNYFNHIEGDLDSVAFPQAILIMDLNNLKSLNDTYGHSAGDVLLVSFGKILKAVFPEERIFRMGGDEFMILLAGYSEDQVREAVDEIYLRCRETCRPLDSGVEIVPSAAIGYSMRLGPLDPLNEAIVRADNRMYRVKSQMKTAPGEDAVPC